MQEMTIASKKSRQIAMVETGLRNQTKQTGDELILCFDVAFLDSCDLPLSYHVHRFVALNRSLRRGYDPNPSPGLIIRFMKR